MKYRILDLINGVYVSDAIYSADDQPEEEWDSLNAVTHVLAVKAGSAITTGRPINYAIIDQDNRVIQSVAVNVFPH